MTESEFLEKAVSDWPAFVFLSAFFVTSIFLSIRNVVVAGIFDPFSLAFAINYGINYGIIAYLIAHGYVSAYHAFIICFFGLVLLSVFLLSARYNHNPIILRIVRSLSPRSLGRSPFLLSLLIYVFVSGLVVKGIGFGLLAETNRFDAARGYGHFIRILDLLSPFIVSYVASSICLDKNHRMLKTIALIVFIAISAIINGAKISIIMSICTAILTFCLLRNVSGLQTLIGIVGLFFGLIFSIFALSVNLQQSGVYEVAGTTELKALGPVLERFIYRLIASGDTSYLLLPNGIIDQIETDNVFARFIMSILGVTVSSVLLGYPLESYSVGRQALLYFDPNNQVAGGPTSHFDLFSYVYLGPFGGCIFVAIIAWFLGACCRALNIARMTEGDCNNKFRLAMLVTLWSRIVLVVVEPTTAIAYSIDFFIYFISIRYLIWLVRT